MPKIINASFLTQPTIPVSPAQIDIPFRFDQTGYPAPTANLIADINVSIFTILSTYIGERVYRPTFGSILMNFIFNPLTLATIFQIKAEIKRAVTAWETRATITNMTFSNPTPGTLIVTVYWQANGGTSSSMKLNATSGTLTMGI